MARRRLFAHVYQSNSINPSPWSIRPNEFKWNLQEKRRSGRFSSSSSINVSTWSESKRTHRLIRRVNNTLSLTSVGSRLTVINGIFSSNSPDWISVSSDFLVGKDRNDKAKESFRSTLHRFDLKRKPWLKKNGIDASCVFFSSLMPDGSEREKARGREGEKLVPSSNVNRNERVEAEAMFSLSLSLLRARASDTGRTIHIPTLSSRSLSLVRSSSRVEPISIEQT